MKKLLLIFLLISIGLFIFPRTSLAKKILPRLKTTGVSGGTSQNISAKVKFRSDRRAVIITLSNLKVASKIEYLLSYNTRGTLQGASGAITNTDQEPVIRELLFGTCSHGVCRYDTGITNARLRITTTLMSGRKIIKNFKLKV